MADSSQDKTEQATPKKLKDERKEGHVLQSKEVLTVISMLATFYACSMLMPTMQATVRQVIQNYIALIPTLETLGTDDVKGFFLQGLVSFGIATLPLALIASVVAIIVTFAQTKGLVNFKSLRPKFSKLNPIAGIKRLFSLKGFMELLKSILKIIVLLWVIYTVLRDEIQTIPKLFDMELTGVASYAGSIMMSIVKKVLVVFVFLAAGDYLYQRWQFQKDLKMTKQEVKEEYKNTEGDPQIKGKIKSKQMEMSRKRMMQQVPEANVIIRNPTHYAIALKYDPEENKAPVLVAKGKGYLALRIVEIAEAHDIITMENKPLARALYAEVKLDQEIPKAYYNAVAEVLAFVYSIKKKELN